MLFIILGKKIKTTQEGTQMQGENLKIVSNFFSCWEQLVGRKWSPEPLPFPPHSPLPSQQWSLSLVFHQFSGFLLLCPYERSSPWFPRHCIPGRIMHTCDSAWAQWWLGSFPGALHLSSQPREPLRRIQDTQLSYSTTILDLLFFCHFSAQGPVSTHRSPWILQSCGCLRAQPGAGHLTLQQNRDKKCPRRFPFPFGAELLFCGRL